MPFRSPDPRRHQRQVSETIFAHAGQTATWRQFISAGESIPEAGLGAPFYWLESTITGVFAQSQNTESQTPGGMMADGMFSLTTREPLQRDDWLLWRGDTFRVDSVVQASPLDKGWVSTIKRSTV